MFIPSCWQLVCTESRIILNPQITLRKVIWGMCYHNWFGSRCFSGFFQRTEPCWTGLYFNNKQITIEHGIYGLCLFVLLLTCYKLLFVSHVFVYETERERACRFHGDWKIKHHMMATVIASETTKHITSPLPFFACFYCLILPGWWKYYPISSQKEEAGRNLWDNSQSQRADYPLWYECALTQWWRPIVISVGRGFKAATAPLFCGVHHLSVCGPEGIELRWKILAQLHIIITQTRYYSRIFTINIHCPAVVPPTRLHLSQGHVICLLFSA